MPGVHVPHINLSFGGPLGVDEIWQCTIKMRQPDDVDGEVSNADLADFAAAHLDDVRTDVGAWWVSANCGASHEAKLKWCKFNAINSAGHYVSLSATNEYTWATPITPNTHPNATNGDHLPQIALALSLRTAASRGPASHGRIYIPIQRLWMTGVHVDAAPLATVLTAFHTFITALNDWPGAEGPASPVVSVIGPPVLTGEHTRPGTSRTVTEVAVGDVLDTQRRRRGKIRETYIVQPLAA